jgi:hypothetical protein
MTCLHHCLEQWIEMPEYRLWYNSNHVVIIEPEHNLKQFGYLPLQMFGVANFKASFKLDEFYTKVLEEYLATT